jgi:hypothetical protein
MTITTHLVTLSSSAVQFPAASPGVCRVYVEPLRSNTHVSYIGTSAVTNDGSGTGVIRELAEPSSTATVINDYWDLENNESDDTIDPTQLYGHGTSGEKLKVTYFQN